MRARGNELSASGRQPAEGQQKLDWSGFCGQSLRIAFENLSERNLGPECSDQAVSVHEELLPCHRSRPADCQAHDLINPLYQRSSAEGVVVGNGFSHGDRIRFSSHESLSSSNTARASTR
jgi:hypothetical protein